mgnify:CR=1 FL=1
MSTIPPNLLGSIIQTQGAQQRQAVDKQREDSAQAERVGGGNFADKLQNVIDETDRDTQVYSDAEGTGSQGRPFEEQPESVPEQNEPSAGCSPPGGLDVQA